MKKPTKTKQKTTVLDMHSFIKVYDYQQGTPQEKEFFIELWDIGGSANHKCSRSIFYTAMNGM